MANHVQFKSAEQVIDAYDNNGINTWAIFVGKELFTTGDSKEMLSSTLELLADGATNCVYTLRVYRNVGSDEIDSKTANHGGFNFRLNGEEMSVTNGQYMTFIKTNNLAQEISGLKAELAELKEGKTESSGKLGMLGEIMEHPVMGDVLGKLALTLIDRMMPAQSAQPQQQILHRTAPVNMQAVGSVANDRELVTAIERLQKVDANLTQHLLKLAHIAENSPPTFKLIVDQLDNLSI